MNNILSEELRSRMKARGLTDMQINAKGVGVVLDLVSEDAGFLRGELVAQVQALRDEVEEARNELKGFERLTGRIDEMISRIEEINASGTELEREKSRDCVRLVEMLLRLVSQYKGIDGNEAFRCISYMIYAALDGQASRLFADKTKPGTPIGKEEKWI